MPYLRALAIVAAVLAAGCGERDGKREASTATRLETAIAARAGGATEPTDEEIDALFARLDAEIAAARADAAEARQAGRAEAAAEAEARARDLERRRRELAQAYLEAEVARVGDAAAETVRDLGRRIGEGIEDAGRRIREALEEPEAPAPGE